MSNDREPITSLPILHTAYPVAAHLLALRQARVITALNAHGIASVTTFVPVHPSGHSPPRPTITYQSTGMQTLPPSDATSFHKIHGWHPTHREIERKIGLAAYGRYMKEPGSNPHDVVYGAAFQLGLPDKKPKYVNSAFQTVDAPTQRKALAKAKVKASIMVNRYKKVAAKDGYDIWAESKDDKIIHTEQCEVTIKLDKEGNVQGDESLTGRFLPNIWKEERQNTSMYHNAAQYAGVLSSNLRRANPSSTLQTLAQPFTSSEPHEPDNQGPLRQIAVIEPSLRELTEDMAIFGDELDAGIFKNNVFSSKAYASDEETYVIYDSGKTRYLPQSRVDAAVTSKPSRKREDSHDDENEERDSKRSRKSKPTDKSDSVRNRLKTENRHHEARPCSKDSVQMPTNYKVSRPERKSCSGDSERTTRTLGDARTNEFYGQPLSPSGHDGGFHNAKSNQHDAHKSHLRSVSPAGTELRIDTSAGDRNEPHVWRQQALPELPSKYDGSLSQHLSLKDDIHQSRRRSRSPTPSSVEHSKGARQVRERANDTPLSALREEQKEGTSRYGSSAASCHSSMPKHSIAEDETAYREHKISTLNTAQAQTHSKLLESSFQSSLTQAVIAASHLARDTSQPVQRLQREGRQQLVSRKQKEEGFAEQVERKMTEAKAKIAERHARRGPRADLQRYVPRALRQAAQEDAALDGRNNTKRGKHKRTERRGRPYNRDGKDE